MSITAPSNTDLPHKSVSHSLLHQLQQEALSRRELGVLRTRFPVLGLSRGRVLIDLDDTFSEELILLDGRVTLCASDGVQRDLAAGDADARRPLARLRPSRYRIEAATDIQYLRLESAALQAVLEELRSAEDLEVPLAQKLADDAETGADQRPGAAGYEVEELFADNGDALIGADAEAVYQEFVIAMNQDRIALPTLPEVARRIHTTLQDDSLSIRAVADMVNHDAAIAAKVMRTANSALYRVDGRYDNVLTAVTRLGVDNTRSLISAFSLKELFVSRSPYLQTLMRRCWQQSCDVAAVCFVLSVELHFAEPGEAMLAGLLHDIGTVPLLVFAQEHERLVADPERLHALLQHGKAEAGALLLQQWSFSDELVAVVKHAQAWQRDHDGGPDLCDLVQVARSYCRSVADELDRAPSGSAASVSADVAENRSPAQDTEESLVPALESLPALARFKQLSADRSYEILLRAKPALEETRALLA